MVPEELPLHLACFYREERIVEQLLAAGANPETYCEYGRNALQCAAYHSVLDREMLNGLTEPYKNIEAKKAYIHLPDQKGDWMATHYVATAIKQSLEGIWAFEPADWTLKNGGGETPFELAARHRHWIITAELAKKQWGVGDDGFRFDTTVSGCPWTRIDLQNVSRKFTYSKSNYMLLTSTTDCLHTSKIAFIQRNAVRLSNMR